jgi:hypothetical protein
MPRKHDTAEDAGWHAALTQLAGRFGFAAAVQATPAADQLTTMLDVSACRLLAPACRGVRSEQPVQRKKLGRSTDTLDGSGDPLADAS